MENRLKKGGVFSLLGESVTALLNNPSVATPFLTIIFIELLLVEILYFSTRFPLVHFFGPIIQKLWGAVYLHYPNNLLILSSILPYAQIAIFIVIGNFFISMSAAALGLIETKQSDSLSAGRIALSRYFHVLVAAFLLWGISWLFLSGYRLVLARALKIHSTTGIFFVIKAATVYGAPYFNLFLGCLATSLLAFLIPALVIDKKNLFRAIGCNFILVWKHFWTVLLIVLIPTILYIPVLAFRANINDVANMTFQGIRVWAIVAGYIFMGVIDAVVYTALTKFFLSTKE
ncbi:MAG: hypothetical protein HQL26_01245 [Candidatus Omnitrophica bacterium]|nr:hypothetical protein [Candidatus Omnitrophota bacterium]